MKTLKTFSLIATFLLFSADIFAQTNFYSKTIIVAKQKVYTIELANEITASNLYFEENQSLDNTYIIAEKDTLRLVRDNDFVGENRSQLFVFEQAIKVIKLFSGNLEGTVTLRMQYVKPLNISHLSLRRKADSCDKPPVIPASEWRKGLAPPRESPAKTLVKHIIVHHSAGSNTTTNFMETVRNIYTFHTSLPPNGNGWNDVGYNFLVSQDGTIFQGRDGQGLLDGDNVLGAHFCSKNGATMGICLLGNYNEVEPTTAAMKSLIKITGWKLAKEKLPVIGQFQHVDGLLNIISGHRDGCSTDCPGNNVYAKLTQIRQQVSQSCSYTANFITVLPTENTDSQSFRIYPQPSADFLMVETKNDFSEKQSPQIFDLQGKSISCSFTKPTPNQWQINIKNLAEGTYLLKFDNQLKGVKFLKTSL